MDYKEKEEQCLSAMPEQYKDRVRRFISSHDWIFAKTYADTYPHEYVVLERLPKDWVPEFYWLVVVIRQYGLSERFFRKHFQYLYIDGYKYWTMGSEVGKTKIINREKQ